MARRRRRTRATQRVLSMSTSDAAPLEDRALRELLALDADGRGVSLTRLAKRLDVRVSVLIRLYTQMSDARIGDVSGPGWARLQLDERGQWRAFATQQGHRRP